MGKSWPLTKLKAKTRKRRQGFYGLLGCAGDTQCEILPSKAEKSKSLRIYSFLDFLKVQINPDRILESSEEKAKAKLMILKIRFLY